NIFRRLSPRVGLTWSAGSGHELFWSVSRGFRAPALVEIGCADPAAACPLPFALGPDPALRPVIATTYESGWHFRGPGGHVDLSADALRRPPVAPGRRGQHDAAAPGLRGGRRVAPPGVAAVRAALHGAQRLRQAIRELRNVRGEPARAGLAGAAVSHARPAAACAGERERGVLKALYDATLYKVASQTSSG